MSRRRLQAARARIGTSGYQYDHWRSVLYEPELPKSRWLSRYVQIFDTVEINNTFYHLPAADVFDRWRDQSPRGFCYALKFSRYGTHLKHLKDPRDTLERFLERAKRLKGKLGPILVQLPPRWKPDLPRLADFLAAAPREHRWAVEFRQAQWLDDRVYDLLRARGAALCWHDLIPHHPWVITADWVYLRYHGVSGVGGNYPPAQLQQEAQRIRECLHQGLDVFAYFNNDLHGYAVRNALALREQVEAGVSRPEKSE